MSDRPFRLILDGKKGGLVKGSSPSSAAKKACKKLSAETGKIKLKETTKDSKKKVYGPYKGSLVKDKIKVKMVGGVYHDNAYFANNENDNEKPILSGKSKILKIRTYPNSKVKVDPENKKNTNPYGYWENDPEIIEIKKQSMKQHLNNLYQILLEKIKVTHYQIISNLDLVN